MGLYYKLDRIEWGSHPILGPVNVDGYKLYEWIRWNKITWKENKETCLGFVSRRKCIRIVPHYSIKKTRNRFGVRWCGRNVMFRIYLKFRASISHAWCTIDCAKRVHFADGATYYDIPHAPTDVLCVCVCVNVVSAPSAFVSVIIMRYTFSICVSIGLDATDAVLEWFIEKTQSTLFSPNRCKALIRFFFCFVPLLFCR